MASVSSKTFSLTELYQAPKPEKQDTLNVPIVNGATVSKTHQVSRFSFTNDSDPFELDLDKSASTQSSSINGQIRSLERKVCVCESLPFLGLTVMIVSILALFGTLIGGVYMGHMSNAGTVVSGISVGGFFGGGAWMVGSGCGLGSTKNKAIDEIERLKQELKRYQGLTPSSGNSTPEKL